MYRGDELKIARFPHLKMIANTGFREQKGINRFKDVPVYANAGMSTYSIAENSPDDLFRIVLRDGKEIATYTNQDYLNYAEASRPSEHDVTYFSACAFSPFGLASVLGCAHH
jgi:hypothetical protein